jgi:hypothetical protein
MGSALARAGLVAALACAAFGYALASPGASARACGAAGPYDFDTFEVEDYVAGYNLAIELAAAGQAVGMPYTLSSGEVIDFHYQGLKSGPRTARLPENPALRVPPSVYKSIAWVESNWSNGAGSVPYGGVGPVLRSFDCGYGLGQITTGMTNSTGNASPRQAIIGTHFLFNLAEGVRILADKWNIAPQFRPIAGNGDPAALEDWYFAVWSYNGFAFSNHPLNPNRDPLRGGGVSPVFHCFDPSAPSYQAMASGSPAFNYGDYTYPERVYGCMRYPPKKDTARIWAAQFFLMPDFTNELVAKAFAPKNFQMCEDGGFEGGCPAMDFPTTFTDTKVIPHADTTPPVDPKKAATLLGLPRLAFSGSTEVTIAGGNDGSYGSATIVVRNLGTFVAPFLVRTSAPWIVVRHPDDPLGRTIDGGVAVGKDTEVVTQAVKENRPRIAQKGYDSVLVITVIPALMPAGQSRGKVWIQPLFGSGSTFEVVVVAMKGENSFPFRAVAPGLSTER